MEHPAVPHWQPLAASSWKLEEMAWIRSLPGVTAHDIDQCMFSCEYLKPTTLLSVNIPGFQRMLNSIPGRG
eukprot:5666058-Pyramimonas_sp.AAC.1